jgi:hypothetical protein
MPPQAKKRYIATDEEILHTVKYWQDICGDKKKASRAKMLKPEFPGQLGYKSVRIRMRVAHMA